MSRTAIPVIFTLTTLAAVPGVSFAWSDRVDPCETVEISYCYRVPTSIHHVLAPEVLRAVAEFDSVDATFITLYHTRGKPPYALPQMPDRQDAPDGSVTIGPRTLPKERADVLREILLDPTNFLLTIVESSWPDGVRYRFHYADGVESVVVVYSNALVAAGLDNLKPFEVREELASLAAETFPEIPEFTERAQSAWNESRSDFVEDTLSLKARLELRRLWDARRERNGKH